MYKCISLLKRKPGMSRSELIHYYETRHAPLIRSLLPQIREYRRNFIDHEDPTNVGAEPDFDVVTEIWFDDRASYEAFMALGQQADIFRQIAEDEENVFDRSATRLFVVEEHGASLPTLQVSEMAAELRTLRDERDIHRKLVLYPQLLDGRDFSRLREIFAEDLTFNYGHGGDHHGIAEIVAWMHRSLDECGGTRHMLGQITVDIDGNRANSRSYVFARHQGQNDLGGAVFDTSGEYIDQWERRPEGWRIVRRDAVWNVITGEPSIVGIERLQLD